MTVSERTRLLSRQVRRHKLAAGAGFMVFVSCLLSGLASLAALRAENQADDATYQLKIEVENRLYAECLAFNEGRETTRDLMRDGDKESGEALIETVTGLGGSVSQDAIERYRRTLTQHLDAIVEEHVATDRDCEKEQRMRRHLDD